MDIPFLFNKEYEKPFDDIGVDSVWSSREQLYYTFNTMEEILWNDD